MKTCTMRRVAGFALLAFMCAPAFAHKPVAVGSLESSPQAPISLFDIQVSQVLYFEPSVEYPRLWMRFTANAGEVLSVQPGVPLIDGLGSVRPAFAVLGPGLPAIDLPFETPDGLGGIPFSTSGVVQPEEFDEPFTGTSSWQFPTEDILLPETGEYLLVAYVPGDAVAKFWIAVGEREEFGLGDILTLPTITLQVRAFHEVFPIGGIGLLAPLVALLALLGTILAKWSAL